MIRLNAQIGFNPIRNHIPIQCYTSTNRFYTVGKYGQIVAWSSQHQPTYQIFPSLNADTDKLTAFCLTPLRLISSQQKTVKIVTIHEDGRLRIFKASDGICINATSHNAFPEKINGITDNEEQSRFALCFSDKKIYIFDSWLMKVLDSFEIAIDSFSIFVRGRINSKKQLEMVDKQGKTYRYNVAALLSESHLDVGSFISNSEKAFEAIDNSILALKSQKTVTSYRKIPEKASQEQLALIIKQLEKIKENNIWEDIFSKKSLSMACVKEMKNSNEVPIVSNLYYIKGNKLWYFFGTNTGNVYGFPAVYNFQEEIVVRIVQEGYGKVAYIQFLDNLMIVSWEGGLFSVYTVDNLQFTINQQLNHKKRENLLENGICYVEPKGNKIYSTKMSAEIKYRLDIYNLIKGKVGLQIFAFQLINNEVFIFDTIHRKSICFRGLPQDSRIFVVLDCDDYYGIAHSKGVDMYSGDRFERRISYEKWVWSDYEFCDKVEWNDDYNQIDSKKQEKEEKVDGINMIRFCDRSLKKKIDYYTASSDLYYETFGLIEDESISNTIYPTFHFIQKLYTQKIIHSVCSQNATSILKVKSFNARRDLWMNTSFMFSLNLNRQLQIFNEDKFNLNDLVNQHFSMFSLFLWDTNVVPLLTQIYANTRKQFIFERRYVEQGLGKSCTLYFDSHSKHNLEPQLLTLSAISSTALLQILASKDIEYTDSMVETVEYFTAEKKKNEIKISPQFLSKMSLSESSFVLKACINLLMSTALSGNVLPLHPIYEYFILNLKNLEQSKVRQLTETEAVWFVYLGIGLIYSEQLFDKEQVKILILRLLSSIEIRNFELHPDLIIVVLKVLNEGIKKWKHLLNSGTIVKLFADLFKIFFLYDGINFISHDDKKFDFRFEFVSQNQSKKMKLQIVKTVVYLSKEFPNEFLQVLRIQALNQKPHLAYPASVIQILRQFLKTEKPTTNLVFYVELLLQCLSPMSPQLRKYVQKNVLATLQIMCSYETISFNHTSQKLSLRTDSNIYIYCLRTSTKWRTITVKEELPPEKSVLKMSPKGTYIALLGDKLKVWRLSSGFWSGVLGAFSQGWTFEAAGKALKWDDSEQSLTVINENPSLNKCFKL